MLWAPAKATTCFLHRGARRLPARQPQLFLAERPARPSLRAGTERPGTKHCGDRGRQIVAPSSIMADQSPAESRSSSWSALHCNSPASITVVAMASSHGYGDSRRAPRVCVERDTENADAAYSPILRAPGVLRDGGEIVGCLRRSLGRLLCKSKGGDIHLTARTSCGAGRVIAHQKPGETVIGNYRRRRAPTA